MITDDKLAELDAAEKAATPGDWAVCEKYDSNAIELAGICSGEYLMRAKAKVDINFIALARNHMRELLDEVSSSRTSLQSALDEQLRLCTVVSDKNQEKLDNTQLRQTVTSQFNENEKLRAELVAAREGLALMAEGEGDDPKVYQEMALYHMKRIDDTLGDG